MPVTYLIVDVESIPDGDLIAAVKYPGKKYTAHEAVVKAQYDALLESGGKLDFIPLTFQVPIVIGAIVASENFNIIKLDTISGDQSVAKFWSMYKAGTIIVSFNGRNFDLPLLELMAFKNGITLPSNYWAKYGPRNRFGDGHIDLIDFIGNNGAHRVPGGLDLLSKLVDRPGKEIVDGVKMDGSRVYGMYMDEEYDQIASYCKRDLLDTYAVFLRTRVMIGDINTNREAELLKLSSNFE